MLEQSTALGDMVEIDGRDMMSVLQKILMGILFISIPLFSFWLWATGLGNWIWTLIVAAVVIYAAIKIDPDMVKNKFKPK